MEQETTFLFAGQEVALRPLGHLCVLETRKMGGKCPKGFKITV